MANQEQSCTIFAKYFRLLSLLVPLGLSAGAQLNGLAGSEKGRRDALGTWLSSVRVLPIGLDAHLIVMDVLSDGHVEQRRKLHWSVSQGR